MTVKVITRQIARIPSGKDAEEAQVTPHLAPVALRPLLAPGVLSHLGHHLLAVQGQTVP